MLFAHCANGGQGFIICGVGQKCPFAKTKPTCLTRMMCRTHSFTCVKDCDSLVVKHGPLRATLAGSGSGKANKVRMPCIDRGKNTLREGTALSCPNVLKI